MPGRALQESDLNAKPDFRGKADAFEGTHVLGCVSAGAHRKHWNSGRAVTPGIKSIFVPFARLISYR